MKCLLMVAHPDDCIIFAWHYIMTHLDDQWHICYLTYKETDPRGAEIKKFWQSHGIKTSFLGFTDNFNDIVTNNLSFDSAQARTLIENKCAEYDLILTHNERGDYGHIHHSFVHECVPKENKTVVCFGTADVHNKTCTTHKQYDLNALPLHREVIVGFGFRKTNYYIT
jgi:LmbE family N-acetylglucosaminyl deacetylase